MTDMQKKAKRQRDEVVNEALQFYLEHLAKLDSQIKCPVVESVAASKKRPDGYTDAIHDALKKVNDTLPVKPIANKKYNRDTLPHQFTLEEWQQAGAGYGTPTPVDGPASQCVHDWQIYHGFHFDDIYCTKCAQTRPLDPSK